MSIQPSAMRRVMREINELQNSPPEGIRIQTSEEDMLDVAGLIEGPEGTPYAGGYFRVKFRFTEEFPAAPPKCWFATKIFHPNVGPTGEICVNTLKKDWKSTYGIAHILVTVKCLLIYPNPESALDEEAGKLLLEDYEDYCSRAKLITSVHATPRKKPVEFEKPSAPQEETPAASSSSSTSTASSPSNSSVAASSAVASPPSSSPSVKSSNSSGTTPLITTTSPPTIIRKPAAPTQIALKVPADKEGLSIGPQKERERHVSPSPLGTADANVGAGGKPNMGVGLGMASTMAQRGGVPGTTAMKRAATGSATSGAEKRKKALKRL